jgi:hypothetical protein
MRTHHPGIRFAGCTAGHARGQGGNLAGGQHAQVGFGLILIERTGRFRMGIQPVVISTFSNRAGAVPSVLL